MREEHCLCVAQGTKLENITEVRSHSHLLTQCDGFLKKLDADNAGVTRHAMADSTAACADVVANARSTAAVQCVATAP